MSLSPFLAALPCPALLRDHLVTKLTVRLTNIHPDSEIWWVGGWVAVRGLVGSVAIDGEFVSPLYVCFHVALLAGRVGALRTLERLLPRVGSDMLLQRGRVVEALPAELALVLRGGREGVRVQIHVLEDPAHVVVVLLALLLQWVQGVGGQGNLHQPQPAHHAHAHTQTLEERNN